MYTIQEETVLQKLKERSTAFEIPSILACWDSRMGSEWVASDVHSTNRYLRKHSDFLQASLHCSACLHIFLTRHEFIKYYTRSYAVISQLLSGQMDIL